jgi:hypothetical protein
VAKELGISIQHRTLKQLKRNLQSETSNVNMALHLASNYPLLILSTFEEHVLMKLVNKRNADTRVHSCIEAGLGPLTKHPIVKSWFGDDLPVEVGLFVYCLAVD